MIGLIEVDRQWVGLVTVIAENAQYYDFGKKSLYFSIPSFFQVGYFLKLLVSTCSTLRMALPQAPTVFAADDGVGRRLRRSSGCSDDT